MKMQMGFGLMGSFHNAEGSIFLKLDKGIIYCDTCIRIPNKLSLFWKITAQNSNMQFEI